MSHIHKTLQDLYDLGRHQDVANLVATFGVDWKPAGVIEFRNGMTEPDKNGSVQLEKLIETFGKYPKQFHELKKYRFICKEILDNWDVSEEILWKIKLNLELTKGSDSFVQGIKCEPNHLKTRFKRPWTRTQERIPGIIVVPERMGIDEFGDFFISKVNKTINE